MFYCVNIWPCSIWDMHYFFTILSPPPVLSMFARLFRQRSMDRHICIGYRILWIKQQEICLRYVPYSVLVGFGAPSGSGVLHSFMEKPTAGNDSTNIHLSDLSLSLPDGYCHKGRQKKLQKFLRASPSAIKDHFLKTFKRWIF